MRGVLVLSALLVAACGSNERSIEVQDGNGQSATVSIKGDGEKVTVRSANGEVVYQQGAQGAFFPAYAPNIPALSSLPLLALREQKVLKVQP